MNRRIKEKRAVQAALRSSFVVLPDIHGSIPRLIHKVGLAINRQIAKGKRKAHVITGDIIDTRIHKKETNDT
jgi:hypothetical protein